MKSPISQTLPLTTLEQHIRKGQLDHLYRSLPTAVVTNAVVSLMLPLILGDSVPAWPLYFVSGVIVFSALLRGILYLFYRKQGDNWNTDTWRVLFNTGLILTSFTWGLAAFILFPPDDPFRQALLMLLLGGIISASIINLSADFTLSITHVQMILIPLILRNLFNPADIRLEITLLLVIYNLFVSTGSYNLSKRLKKSLITEFKYGKADKKLKLSEQRFKAIFNKAPTGIFYYSPGLILLECNKGFVNIIQSPEEKLRGLCLSDLSDTRVIPALKKVLENENGYYEGPYHAQTSDAHIYVTLRTSPIRNARGDVEGGVAIVEDITEKTRIQQEIHHQAYHDTLTGLPNRQLLLDRLSQALKSARRHSYKGVILYLDLDKFKLVNDSMGHQTGDLLLKEVAHRLTGILRQEDTVSRLGGDEFVILLPEIITDNESSVIFTRTVADKVHSVLTQPFHINNQIFHSSTSIGAIIFDGEEDSPEKILKYADTAMYHAKDQGRNRTSFFHKEMDALMQEQISLESDLRRTLKNNGLEIYLQPIVNIAADQISGAEALLRWFHPEKGFISPEKIVRIAENTGQILPLGKWIMKRSLQIYAEWLETQESLLEYISINISIKQILQPDFVESTIQCIQESSVPPERIVLEITESILITDFDNTVRKMRILRDYGVQFALDDFGTGYSSLSYLKKLPLDKLKIDRAFTENLLSDKDDYALVDTIMSIASHFNLKLITEGVEQAEQIEVLKGMGCPYYQGYFCSKPLKPEDFLQFAREYNRPRESL